MIAGGGVRAVVEAAGISDILSKSMGSSNILNVVQATFAALKELQDFRLEAGHRGVDPNIWPPSGIRRKCVAEQSAQATGKTIKIKWVRSAIGYNVAQKRTIKALGLTRLHQVVERPDNPAVRGMVNAVQHLVEVTE